LVIEVAGNLAELCRGKEHFLVCVFTLEEHSSARPGQRSPKMDTLCLSARGRGPLRGPELEAGRARTSSAR
jgi:hypothetical protein